MPIPTELRTSRLVLRPFDSNDAAELLSILDANQEHLQPWIPARVADPALLPLVAQRLAEFKEAFITNREWRFALRANDDGRLLGEVDLFPRDAHARVDFADADRAELGYWLRADDTGRGFITEAARAVVDAAFTTRRFTEVEIRCDPRNAPSVAVARRLGFTLCETTSEPLEVWRRAAPATVADDPGMPCCRVVTAGDPYVGRQNLSYVAGLTGTSVGSRGICMTVANLPPGARAKAHLHREIETAIYVIDGEAATYYGDALQHVALARSGEYVYIPADLPHLVVNHSSTVCRAVVTHTAADDQTGIELLPHLDALVR